MAYSNDIEKQVDHYRTLGASAGSNNKPSSSATEPDDNEAVLENDAKRFAHVATNTLDKELTDQNQIIASSLRETQELAALLPQILADDSAEPIARQNLLQQKSALVSHKVMELRHLAALNYFKSIHNIRHEASYPEDLFTHFAFIFLAVILEILLNTIFFANDTGFLGGFVVALVVSLINVFSTGIIGHIISYRNHVEATKKTFGNAMIVVLMVWMAFWNSVISAFRHYSELQQEDSLATNLDAFSHAWSDALGIFTFNRPFSDMNSFVLFFLGIAIGCYCAYKGYKLEDAYPGYASKHKAWRAAREGWETQLTAAKQALHTHIEKQRNQLSEAKGKLMQGAARINSVKSGIEQSHNQCISTLMTISREFQHCRDIYRQTNTKIRSTPPPNYFADTSSSVPESYDGQLLMVTASANNVISEYGRLSKDYLEKISSRVQQLLTQMADLEVRLTAQLVIDIEAEARAILIKEAEVMPNTI